MKIRIMLGSPVCYNAKMDVRLQKDDILLRIFKLSEANELFQLINNNREHLGKWFHWAESTRTLEDSQKFLQEEMDKYKGGKGLYLGIWRDNKLVGVISFNYINKLNNNASIGYWLGKEYEGKGIMIAACTLLISYGFTKLKLHRIGISHAEHNERSAKLPKKLGFTHEGRFRQSEFLNGKFIDQEFYSILSSEWK